MLKRKIKKKQKHGENERVVLLFRAREMQTSPFQRPQSLRSEGKKTRGPALESKPNKRNFMNNNRAPEPPHRKQYRCSSRSGAICAGAGQGFWEIGAGGKMERVTAMVAALPELGQRLLSKKWGRRDKV